MCTAVRLQRTWEPSRWWVDWGPIEIFKQKNNDIIRENFRDVNFGKILENVRWSRAAEAHRLSGVRKNENILSFVFYHELAYFSIHFVYSWLYFYLLEWQRIHALLYSFLELNMKLQEKNVYLNVFESPNIKIV